ncbi:MAG TPA: hypothetical protein DIU39_05080 [Flavobacteriales bacterium]|nr:hypothetical protein [Flavobacteriales bacterium]
MEPFFYLLHFYIFVEIKKYNAMKRNLLFASAFIFGAGMIAQNQSIPQVSKANNVAMPFNKVYYTGDEIINMVKPHNPYVTNKASYEEIIGVTTYDLQTNSSPRRKIYNPGDGTISAVWTYSETYDVSASDRGTGYNYFDGNAWGPQPTARLEASTRTGWSSIVVTGSGEEVVVNHQGTGPLPMLKRTKGTGTWTQGNVSSNLGVDLIWPRIDVGGPSNNTLHVIAVTAPSAFGGPMVQGLDGALVYYRSQDGGNTWDIVDSILPGLDTTNFANSVQTKGYNGDEYAIAAKGNTVAIVVFDDWNDVVLMKSTDNGDTWTKTIINDFMDNPTASDTIQTSDGSGSVIIDNNGMVHVFYGNMRVLDDDGFGTGNTSYFPGTNGIMYWNESMGAAPGSNSTNAVMITGALDLDNNGQLDIVDPQQIPAYFNSLSSYPTAGIDANGTIYLAYAALVENLNNGIQNYRHIYMMKSSDGGNTWTTPVDVNGNQGGAGIHDFDECMYPSIADLVDTKVHLVYQQDGEPGSSVTGSGGNGTSDDGDPFSLNNIYYLSIDTNLTPSVSVEEIKNKVGLRMYPNPATEAVVLTVNNANYSYEIMDMTGRIVIANTVANKMNERIDISNLPTGMYFVKVNTTLGSVIEKLEIIK